MPRAIIRGPMQDGLGNTLYLETSSDMIKHRGTTVEAKLNTIDTEIADINEEINLVNSNLSDLTYQTAGGTATAITLTMQTLVNGYAKTFIASANNNGAATTINGKPLYKPGTTTAPTLIKDKAYTVWYNEPGICFFIKASATGTVTSNKVLAGETYSTEVDTDLVGTMINQPAQVTALSVGSNGTNKYFRIPNGAYLTNTAQGYPEIIASATQIDPNIISDNVKSGVTIAGVSGSSTVVNTADAVLDPQYLLSGQSGYDDGVKKNGTMIDRGQYGAQCTSYSTWSSRVYLRLPIGFYHGGSFDGNGGVAETYVPYSNLASLVGLTANKLISGNTVLDIAGTGANFRSVTGVQPANTNTVTLGWQPKIVIYGLNSGSPDFVYSPRPDNTGSIWWNVGDNVQASTTDWSVNSTGFHTNQWSSPVYYWAATW